MFVVGVIGGVASGKSEVTETLRGLGACILDADQIGHQVLRIPAIREQVGQRWGDAIRSVDGEINRRALAAIVFDPARPDELPALERITHPEIEKRIRDHLRQVADHDGVLVLDAPVMIKTGWYRLCDLLLFVDCPRTMRSEFARARGWDETMLDSREASQASLERKRELATHTIHNHGTLKELREQVVHFWNENLKCAPGFSRRATLPPFTT